MRVCAGCEPVHSGFSHGGPVRFLLPAVVDADFLIVADGVVSCVRLFFFGGSTSGSQSVARRPYEAMSLPRGVQVGLWIEVHTVFRVVLFRDQVFIVVLLGRIVGLVLADLFVLLALTRLRLLRRHVLDEAVRGLVRQVELSDRYSERARAASRNSQSC